MGKALSGIRVVDLTTFMSGPFASMVLGDLGAEIIKIEQREVGDNSRHIPPHYHGGECLYYLSLNRNKKSITLDINTDKGREVFYDLVLTADVVIDNYRPGVTKKLGVTFDDIKRIKPDIVCCSITAFGLESPHGSRPAYDLTIQAISGAMSLNGSPETGPLRLGVPMGDLASSLWAVIGILAALRYRDETGQGQFLDISLLESLAALITYPTIYYTYAKELPKPAGTAHQSIVPFNVYPTKDEHISIACASDKFWELLCNALGRPELKDDPRYKRGGDRLARRHEVDRIITDILQTKTAAEWNDILVHHGVPFGIINTLKTVLNDPAVQARGFVVPIKHGDTELKLFGSPLRMSATPVDEYNAPPRLGANTEEVLRDLGYDAQRIVSLKEAAII